MQLLCVSTSLSHPNTRKRVLSAEHLDTLTGMGNLVVTYWNRGRWNEAKELEIQVIATSLRLLGMSCQMADQNHLAKT
jgi:hypothetical protein